MGKAQKRIFLVLKVVLYAVVVISEVLHLSTKSRCSRCCMAHLCPLLARVSGILLTVARFLHLEV